jgi:hypothetical protein
MRYYMPEHTVYTRPRTAGKGNLAIDKCRTLFIPEVSDYIASVLHPGEDTRWVKGCLYDLDTRDIVLGDPLLLQAIQEHRFPEDLSGRYYYYVRILNALMDNGVDNPDLADYLSESAIAFAYRYNKHKGQPFTEDPLTYVKSQEKVLESAGPSLAFNTRMRIGNYGIFFLTMYPDTVEALHNQLLFPSPDFFRSKAKDHFLEAYETGPQEVETLKKLLKFLCKNMNMLLEILTPLLRLE